MTPKEITMVLYCVATIMVCLAGMFMLGAIHSNMVFKQEWRDVADDLLTSCEEDGLKGCHIKWEYKDGVIVRVTSVGAKEEL